RWWPSPGIGRSSSAAPTWSASTVQHTVRSRKVRPPREEEETGPPTLEHSPAMLTAISPGYRLHLLLIEGTGLRVGEVAALHWGDLDLPGRAHASAGPATKRRTSGRRFGPLE